MSMWNKESIANERRMKGEDFFKEARREDLIERIIALETELYPFAYVLGSLDEKSWRGTNVTSKLFPLLSEDDKYQDYKSGEDGQPGKTVEIDTIPEAELHSVEYYQIDSINILDGKQLNDDFEIIAAHQEAPGAYVGCGSISMGDVRAVKKLLFGDRRPDSDEQSSEDTVVKAPAFRVTSEYNLDPQYAKRIAFFEKKIEEILKKALKDRDDRENMINNLLPMLGPKARQVWDMWQTSNIVAMHYDWGPEGAVATGEERAQMHLEIEEACKTAVPVENIDDDIPKDRFDKRLYPDEGLKDPIHPFENRVVALVKEAFSEKFSSDYSFKKVEQLGRNEAILVGMIKNSEPPLSMTDELREKGLGQYTGGHVDSWTWSDSTAFLGLSQEELLGIYQKLIKLG